MSDYILVGAIATASIVIALFFLRFWKSTQDRFFLYFAFAFLIEGINRVLQGPDPRGGTQLEDHYFYVFRLIAYGLIVVAIWDKNKRGRGK